MNDCANTTAKASLVIGVTGHRKLRPAEIPALTERLRVFFLDLRTRYPELPLVLLSSLAEGSDQLVAEVAFDLGLRVIAPLPVPMGLYREDFDQSEVLARFDAQARRAEVLTLPMRSNITAEDIARPGHDRDLQYAQAGMFIASHCHILLALWDGQETDRVGGTAQVIRFHLYGELPPPLERRRQAVQSLPGLLEDSLVFHLPTGRSDDDREVSSIGRWLTSDQAVASSPEPLAVFDLMYRRQSQFNIDVREQAATIEAEAVNFSIEPVCPVRTLFQAADCLARSYRRRVSQVLRLTYVLAALMGCAFIAYSDISAQDVMIYLFLALFLIGFGVALLAQRREWHRKYIDYRALAEGLRVQSFWRRAGVVDTGSLSFAHDDFLQTQDADLGWIRNVMRWASLEGLLVPAQPDAEAVAVVIQQWIGTAESSGQLSYYARTAERCARQQRRAQFLGMSCLWLGFAVCVVLAILARQIGGTLQSGLVVLMGVLSVAAAVHEAYAYKTADKELIKQYRFMARIFRAARRRLDNCGNLADQRQTLRLLGEAALAEHAEWTLMHRERPLEHSRF